MINILSCTYIPQNVEAKEEYAEVEEETPSEIERKETFTSLVKVNIFMLIIMHDGVGMSTVHWPINEKKLSV